MYIGFHVKYSLFLADFPDTFLKNIQILNFMKILLVVTVLFHADRRTDGQRGMMKLTVTFLNFGNAPKSDIDKLYSIHRLIF
jgi:hypothetical protein